MQILDLIGIFALAVSGSLMAIGRDYDVVGIAILAVVTALGGGIVRDLMLGDTPPLAFTRWQYLVVALAAAAVTSVAHPWLGRSGKSLLVFDAAGLGLFCVAGTQKALDQGVLPVAAALLGVTTAVGGGVLRDVLAREIPALFRADSELYAVPALAGALVVGIASTFDASSPALGAGVAAAIFLVRVLALLRHWRGPRARGRRPSGGPSPPTADLKRWLPRRSLKVRPADRRSSDTLPPLFDEERAAHARNRTGYWWGRRARFHAFSLRCHNVLAQAMRSRCTKSFVVRPPGRGAHSANARCAPGVVGDWPLEGGGAVGGRPTVATLELARTPGHLIRRAQRVHNVLWLERVGAEPTGPQFAVLSSVARRPGSDQKTLGALASLDKSTTTDVVGRLTRHGWLTTAPDEDDRRRKVLHLSRPARAALHALTRSAMQVQEALLAPIAETDREWFLRALSALAYEGDAPTSARDAGGLGLELSRTPGHLIRRAQQAYTARWTRTFAGRLTGPQYAVLCAVAQHQPIDQLRLGEAASLDKSSTAEVVERLAAQELLSVVADANDRRRKALRLSERAVAELPAMTEAAGEVQAQLLELLAPDERARFLDLLAAVAYQLPNTAVADPGA